MTVLKPEFDTLSNHFPGAQNTTTEKLNDKTQQMRMEGNDKAAACHVKLGSAVEQQIKFTPHCADFLRAGSLSLP